MLGSNIRLSAQLQPNPMQKLGTHLQKPGSALLIDVITHFSNFETLQTMKCAILPCAFLHKEFSTKILRSKRLNNSLTIKNANAGHEENGLWHHCVQCVSKAIHTQLPESPSPWCHWLTTASPSPWCASGSTEPLQARHEGEGAVDQSKENPPSHDGPITHHSVSVLVVL